MSGYSTTPSLGLKKPISGADDDLWGTHWNDNADILDTVIGPLTASSVTSVAGKTGAVTLVHTDITDWTATLAPYALSTAVPLASSTPPLMDGAATAGSSALYAREGHVHPSDTTRQTAAQVQAAVAPAFNGVGRNLIHNPLFNVAQRGNGSFTTNSGYTADRWQLGVTLDTVNVQRVAIGDTYRAVIGDEAAEFMLTNTFTGNAGATANNFIQQPIEDAYRLAGKTVTVSFWANATAPAIGVNIIQHFGTGGSPSASVFALSTGIKIALTATWTRYSATITAPSVAGKTFGTNNDSRTALIFFCSSGSNNNAFAGNIGVQGPNVTINLWGVQLEIGNVATPLEKPDPRYDMSNCQRFYLVGSTLASSYGAAGNIMSVPVYYPTTMRSPPLVAVPTNTSTNLGAITPGILPAGGLYFQSPITAAGAAAMNIVFTASADL